MLDHASAMRVADPRSLPQPSPDLRVLIVTKIYPNAREPLSSPFNRQQFAALARRCHVEVMASIPWFPGAGAFGRWSAAGRLVGVGREDVIDGVPVRHPRFLFLPRVGLALQGSLYSASLLPAIMRRRRDFDVVMGSWAYPDGFAAVALARLLGLPAVIKLHGSDMHVVAQHAAVRAHLRWALPRAGRVVAVSDELARQAASFGVPPARLAVVRNGTDPELFHPRDRREARARLGLPATGRMILQVGRLDTHKGVLDLIEAFGALSRAHPDASLVLVGDGPARAACEEAAARVGPAVRLAGARPLEEVPLWMAAANVVALASWHEGMPNVLLEALACDRPIVATRVGGIPELVAREAAGELVPAHDPAALAEALWRVASRDEDAHVGESAAAGWDESARKLHRVLADAHAEHAGAGGRASPAAGPTSRQELP